MIANAFSKNYAPQIKLKPTPRETQLHAAGKAQREKLVLADAPNQFHVPSQAESDESKRKKGRRIGV
jgi:hypothetical protein